MHLDSEISAAPTAKSRSGCVSLQNCAILWQISVQLAGAGMAASKKEKTVSYRRAVWLNDDPTSTTLGACLRLALAKLKHPDERIIPRGNGQETKLCDWRDRVPWRGVGAVVLG